MRDGVGSTPWPGRLCFREISLRFSWLLRTLLQEDFFSLLFSRLLRTLLLRIEVRAAQRGYAGREAHGELSRVLGTYVRLWLEAKERQRERDRDADSLYSFRKTPHARDEDDELENERALRDAFPTFDAEFTAALTPGTEEVTSRCDTADPPVTSADGESDAERFVATVDVGELGRVHARLYCGIPACQAPFAVHHRFSPPPDSLYLKAFGSGYQAASLVLRLCPCE